MRAPPATIVRIDGVETFLTEERPGYSSFTAVPLTVVQVKLRTL